jgi:hypothetical protein
MLLHLLTTLALSQITGPDRGVRLSEYQSTADTAWYVNGTTGKDTNTCHTPATACLTHGGMHKKWPVNVLHSYNVFTSVAPDGGVQTYTESVVQESVFQGDGGATYQAFGNGLDGGGMVPANLAAGSTTGTITSFVNTVPVTVTDTAQSGFAGGWVDGGLVGMWYVPTTGGAANISTGPAAIVANTATTVTLDAPLSIAPSVGNRYQIMVPGVVVTDAVVLGQALTVRATGVRPLSAAAGLVKFVNYQFQSTGATGAGCRVGSLGYFTTTFQVSSCSALGAGAGAGVALTGGILNFVNSIAKSNNGNGLLAGQSVTTGGLMSFTGSRSYFSGGTNGAYLQGPDPVVWNVASGATFETTVSSLGVGLHISTTATRTGAPAESLLLRCTAGGANTTGIQGSGAGTGLEGGGTGKWIGATSYVDGCGFGVISAGSPAGLGAIIYFNSGTLTCNNVPTACVVVSQGGVLRIPGAAVITGTTPTDEMLVDGDGYTFANVNNLNTGSRAIHNLQFGSTIHVE